MTLTNLWLTALVSIVVLGGGLVGVIVSQDRSNNKAADTAERVKQLEPVVSKVSVIESKIGYIEESQKRIESNQEKMLDRVDRALESKK